MLVRVEDNVKPMPQPPAPRLSPDAIATLKAWNAAGKPMSNEMCKPDTPPPPPPDTCDTQLRPAAKYKMPKDRVDQYVCYGVSLIEAQKKHITEMRPLVDNAKIVHHLVVLESPTATSPMPVECKSGMGTTLRMVYAWAPGGAAVKLPPEAGFPLEGTKHYIVQLHLNNTLALDGESDGTGIEMCTTKNLRPNDADILAFGTQKFTIPANGATLTKNCTFGVPNGLGDLTFFAAMPHMHEIGKSISTKLEPKGGGAAVDMGTIANWDFQTQYWIPFTAKVKAGDTIRTTCKWQNTRSTEVRYGGDTLDEMCYSFSMYYPRITGVAGLSSWALPASLSSCN
jgi:Copper type II ascorbate-dependent monooxygenase, C-terminal domain/Copper type II ascorbate-dependent monooxygenase, N-terminal domain